MSDPLDRPVTYRDKIAELEFVRAYASMRGLMMTPEATELHEEGLKWWTSRAAAKSAAIQSTTGPSAAKTSNSEGSSLSFASAEGVAAEALIGEASRSASQSSPSAGGSSACDVTRLMAELRACRDYLIVFEPRPYAVRLIRIIKAILAAKLDERIAEAERKERMHWAAYVGTDEQLVATRERERITQDHREREYARAEAAEARCRELEASFAGVQPELQRAARLNREATDRIAALERELAEEREHADRMRRLLRGAIGDDDCQLRGAGEGSISPAGEADVKESQNWIAAHDARRAKQREEQNNRSGQNATGHAAPDESKSDDAPSVTVAPGVGVGRGDVGSTRATDGGSPSPNNEGEATGTVRSGSNGRAASTASHQDRSASPSPSNQAGTPAESSDDGRSEARDVRPDRERLRAPQAPNARRGEHLTGDSSQVHRSGVLVGDNYASKQGPVDRTNASGGGSASICGLNRQDVANRSRLIADTNHEGETAGSVRAGDANSPAAAKTVRDVSPSPIVTDEDRRLARELLNMPGYSLLYLSEWLSNIRQSYEAKIKRLVDALRPFANAIPVLTDGTPDGVKLASPEPRDPWHICYGHLRTAAKLVKEFGE